MSDLLRRLAQLEGELAEAERRIADPDVIADQSRYREEARHYHELEQIVSAGRSLATRIEDRSTIQEMISESDPSDRVELAADLQTADEDIDLLTEAFRFLLLPADPNAGRNVIVEIRGAEGGEEANLFARDLFEMYRSYAGSRKWRFEVLGSSPSPMGGFTEVTFLVAGDEVWTALKHEAGPHRVQRVPVTESQGRVHTSSATVAVLPEAEDVDVEINDAELKYEVFRASGPGGQSVNTTDSAVRLTHLPTGLVVSMQDEKSQLQNKAKALRVIRSRLLKLRQDEQAAESADARRDQIGGGGRSEKIRTYNFKENRVSDHRIGLTLYKLDKVLNGELNEVVDALVADERTRQLTDGDPDS